MRFLLALIGFLAIVAAIAAGVYFFGGFYNVAANALGHPFVEKALQDVREASIARRAEAKPPGSFDDPATIKAGAQGFAKHGCVVCHGGIGVQRDVFARGGMNPGPPGLKTLANDDPAAIFWVVRNGIRMTAMPSFGKVGVKDEDIWPIVAFIKKSQSISPEDYKAWTMPAAAAASAAPVAAPPPAAAASPAPEAPPAVVTTPAPPAPAAPATPPPSGGSQ
jgi:hypothetical protein